MGRRREEREEERGEKRMGEKKRGERREWGRCEERDGGGGYGRECNNLTLHLKQLEKEEQKNPKASRRKEIIKREREKERTREREK